MNNKAPSVSADTPINAAPITTRIWSSQVAPLGKRYKPRTWNTTSVIATYAAI